MVLKRILVVDDERNILVTLKQVLEDEGYLVEVAEDTAQMYEKIRSFGPDIVLLDIWLQNEDGISALATIQKLDPLIQVVMMSGHGTIETAVESLKKGAYDFIEKPIAIERLLLILSHAFESRLLKEENSYLAQTFAYEPIIGRSQPIRQLCRFIEHAAESDAFVLLKGGVGSGKELVARHIHFRSRRRVNRFIVFKCSIFSSRSEVWRWLEKEELLEKGVYGTFFMDDLKGLVPEVAGFLYDFLLPQSVEQHIRWMASTSVSIEVLEGLGIPEEFLRVLMPLTYSVPSLAERIEDLDLLVDYFLRHSSYPNMKVDSRQLLWLKEYSWPGNIRELKGYLELASLYAEGGVISRENPVNRILLEAFGEGGERKKE